MDLSINFTKIWKDIIEVLRSPKDFFKKQKEGEGIREAFIFYVVLTVISLILTLINIYVLSPALGYETVGVEILEFIIATQLISLGLGFVWAYVIHLTLGLFKSKTTYAHAFRLYVYSRTPTYLFNWIPVIGLFVSFYSLYLLVIGTAELAGFNIKKSILATVVFIIAMLILSVLLGSLTTITL